MSRIELSPREARDELRALLRNRIALLHDLPNRPDFTSGERAVIRAKFERQAAALQIILSETTP